MYIYILYIYIYIYIYIHRLKQPQFTYSVCGPFTKNK